MIVREGIIEVLKATGAYHADDLDHLGIPDEHRNIIGSQTAKLVNQKWIEEVGRRKSILPTRNGAKSGIYRLTDLGKSRIAGVGGGNESGHLSRSDSSGHSSHSGDAGLLDPGSGADGAETSQEPPGPEEAPAISTASPQSGKTRNCLPGSGAGAPSPKGSGGAVLPCSSSDAALPDHESPEPEPLSLLPEPDPESWAA